jgi:hypothetical protein
MSILFLNGSPKSITSASQYFLSLVKMQSVGCKTKQIKLQPILYNEIFSHFSHIDALVISLPVYVDGVPSHVLRFMKEAEQFLTQNPCSFKLYVISNCGFYEGHQCKHLLSIMRTFCKVSGLTWGGSVGIGAGEMLSAIRISLITTVLSILISVPTLLLLEGSFVGLWISSAISVSVFLLLSLRLYYSMWRLGRAVCKGRIIPDFYTGLTLCPRFVFIIVANMYWIVRAAYHGCGFWEMYKKISL